MTMPIALGPDLPPTRHRCWHHSVVRTLIYHLSAVVPGPDRDDVGTWSHGRAFDEPTTTT